MMRNRFLTVTLCSVVWFMLGGVPSLSRAADRPFGLPFAGAPGPNSWLIAQQYGNTTGAFNSGRFQYAAGQGLHFGLDFSVPCQTPIVALADGLVDGVDNLSHGAAPHNLAIRHIALGYLSFYGHLYSKPTVVRGQPVKRGEVIALSGDPEGTCVSRPHLHLEIRSLDYGTTYNPTQLIDADWTMLSSIGGFGGGFAKDLYYPNRWQTLADQPNVHFGDNILNNYPAVWPPPARLQPPPLARPALSASPINAAPQLNRLTAVNCCSQAWWAADGGSVRFWNGADGQRATLQAVGLDGKPVTVTIPEPGLESPDGKYALQATLDLKDGSHVSIVRLADKMTWPLTTGGAWPRFSPDSRRLLWQYSPADAVPGTVGPDTEIWIANVDGSNRTRIVTVRGGSTSWLDSDHLLLSTRLDKTLITHVSIYTISTGESTLLASLTNLRGMSVAPGGATLLYYVTFQADPTAGGMYLLKAQAGATPIKLPFFGSWRWRDSQSIIYRPFAPGTPDSLVVYDTVSGQSRTQTDPKTQPLTILNDDWSVSPDGGSIVFWNAEDRALWRIGLSG